MIDLEKNSTFAIGDFKSTEQNSGKNSAAIADKSEAQRRRRAMLPSFSSLGVGGCFLERGDDCQMMLANWHKSTLQHLVETDKNILLKLVEIDKNALLKLVENDKNGKINLVEIDKSGIFAL